MVLRTKPGPLLTLRAQRLLMRVALLNVLHNAVKFSPDRSVLHILCESIEREGHIFHRISIHDNGPGIAPGEHLRVDRFFTSAVHQVTAPRGSGLGLSIARLIIDRNGGRIYFEENIVNGAKCCIELPISTKKIQDSSKG
jgi:K+-sensing histidine kinase KdpD